MLFVFNHDKRNVFEALGLTESEYMDYIEVIDTLAKRYKKVSEVVEHLLISNDFDKKQRLFLMFLLGYLVGKEVGKRERGG